MARFEIHRFQTNGVPIDILMAVNEITAVRRVNDIGELAFVIPYDGKLIESFHKMQQLQLWRNGALQFSTRYFLMNWVAFHNSSGERLLKAYAVDANWLLSSRIVAYPAASSQAKKTGKADNLMKAIVRENMGALAPAERQIAALLVLADSGEGPTVSKGFSWRNVLTVLQELSEQSQTTATPVYFDIQSESMNDLRFVTALHRLGENHGARSSDPRLVGAQFGNLREASASWLMLDEVTSVYAGGQGEEADRLVVNEKNQQRINLFQPYNLIETFVDSRNDELESAVRADALAMLKESRPRVVVSGLLSETEGMRYDRDFRFGDTVAVEAFGVRLNCMIREVGLNVSASGERIDVKLEGAAQ